MSEYTNLLPLSYKTKIQVLEAGCIEIILLEKVDDLSGEKSDFYAAIADYISEFNCGNSEYKAIEHLFNRSCDVVINFHKPTALVENSNEIYNFCHVGSDKDFYPKIHFTVSDLLNVTKDTKEPTKKMGCVKRYAAIMDSSIWNYYVPIKRDESGKFDFTCMLKAAKSILTNSAILLKDGNLYDLAIAREHDNLIGRLLEQSYLLSGPNSAHGSRVSPFLFHSEQKMASNSIVTAERITKFTNNKKVIKRRVLFLDDHCEKSMSPFDKDKPTEITKKDIITTRLEEVAALYDSTFDDLFELHCITHLDELEILRKKKFDIILVDYLLSDSKKTQEYGYQILEKIKDSDFSIRDSRGPIGKYWIIFTSAFTYAVQERLLAEGYSHSDENWYIGRTACPTTTPELFKYNLLSLMERQMSYITEIDEWESRDNRKQKVITLIDYLTYLFDDLGDVRIRAIDNFNSLLHLRSRYDRLKRDYYMGGKEKGEEAKENGSPLVQALFPDMDCCSNAYWEHIQHLIYLIAYGNILQWNEMWDEYIFVKENLRRAEKVTGTTGICKQIEAYIIDIKSANFK